MGPWNYKHAGRQVGNCYQMRLSASDAKMEFRISDPERGLYMS